jgi:hypothetical protein
MVIVQGHTYTNESNPIGYVTLTKLDEDIIYGVFSTIDEAIQFGSKLIEGTTVIPVYEPSLH